MSEAFLLMTDFNAAMHAFRAENREDLSGIREELGALRGLLQTNFDYRVDQAKVMAEIIGRINTLEEKHKTFSRLFGGISITVGALLAWKFLELAVKK